MIRIVWRFKARPEKAQEFLNAYSWKGKWAMLFGHSPDYQGTILLRDTTAPLTFLVIDRWANVEAFPRFRHEFGAEYDRLDQQCTELTEEETLIGTFSDESG